MGKARPKETRPFAGQSHPVPRECELRLEHRREEHTVFRQVILKTRPQVVLGFIRGLSKRYGKYDARPCHTQLHAPKF